MKTKLPQLQSCMIILVLMLGLLKIRAAAQDGDSPLFEEINIATSLSNNTNIRSDPSTTQSSLGTLRFGDRVTILEQIADGQNISGNTLWYHVQLADGTEGYIWSGALSSLEIQRKCLHFIEDDSVWILDRSTTRLLTYDNQEERLIGGGETGDNPLLWATLVKPSELERQIGASAQLNLQPYTDANTCTIAGVIVMQGGFHYIAVREAPRSPEIRFLVQSYVSNIREADTQTAASINAVLLMPTASPTQPAEDFNARFISWQETEVQGQQFVIGSTMVGRELSRINPAVLSIYLGKIGIELTRPVRIELLSWDGDFGTLIRRESIIVGIGDFLAYGGYDAVNTPIQDGVEVYRIFLNPDPSPDWIESSGLSEARSLWTSDANLDILAVLTARHLNKQFGITLNNEIYYSIMPPNQREFVNFVSVLFESDS